MENSKKSRTVLRGSFSRTANEMEFLLSADIPDVLAIEAKWELLQSKYEELKVLDHNIYEMLLEDTGEAVLERELENCDIYAEKFAILKSRFNKLFRDVGSVAPSIQRPGTITHISMEEISGMRKFKLPTIQFKQYDGSIKGWLTFWAQFRKIHEDDCIDKHDKIEYLVQATVPGSRARQLVDSYPAMGENYEKIVNSMQTRFGREDLQIEVYVRELLKLIISNSSSKSKTDISILYDSIETQLRSLETLGITSDKCSAMLYPLIESCLPQELIRVWQRTPSFSISEDDPMTSSLELRLKNLMLFLGQEVENEQRLDLAAEGFGLQKEEPYLNKKKFFKKSYDGSTATELMNTEMGNCLFCAGSHDSETCFKAQKMTFVEKKNALSRKRACFCCLKIGHLSRKCRGRLRCVLCSRSHVTLMCPELPANRNSIGSHEKNKEVDATSKDLQKDQTLGNQTSMHVFLQTLRLTLQGPNGLKTVRALIDSGSQRARPRPCRPDSTATQRSYILKSTAVQLGYNSKSSEKIVHCLFGGAKTTNIHNCYDITISRGNYSCTIEALDQLAICGDVVPVFHGPWAEEARVFNIEISDDAQSGLIELLIGADMAGNLYTGGHCKLPCGLIAMETHFGWTFMGKIPTNVVSSNMIMTTLNLLVRDAAISELWELDALGIKEPSDKKTKEDMALAAKNLFLQTVCVDQDRRYEVRLPWLEDHPPLPTNYRTAQKRLHSIIHKLKNDCHFEEYAQIFKEWEQEGIIEKVGTTECIDVNKGHYLPHRPVLKENSTTKMRPVFDASAHDKEKPSLNQCLETGSNLIELIPSLLIRFRLNKIGIVADIRKAFLQISINERDRDSLRFLWVNPEGQEVILRHKRVVFGVKSSPFLLGSTLEYHLSRCFEKCDDAGAAYSHETVQRLKSSFYVDNCVTSLPDEKSLTKFIRESVAIMAEGQFELRGWEHTQNCESKAACSPCSVLGLSWCPLEDTLAINQECLKDDLDSEVSKRQILSVAQRIFDPIGYTCPAVLVPKLILQRLWQEKLTWDQPVGDDIARCFRNWMKESHYFSLIKIPRWIKFGDPRSHELSLHTFCDASKDAYACVIFLRVVLQEKISVFLLAARARVAPLKKSSSKMTIPRLELLAATIGARLYAHVTENLGEKVDSFFWSDSSTVISWIQRKEEWGTFVWNRVTEIRELTPAQKWHHLPGSHNPADLPSRGCSPKQLLDSRWWEGPKWLYGEPKTWPFFQRTEDEEEINSERKKKLVTTLLNANDSHTWHFDYFSKYRKTVRMMAWVLRFVYNCSKETQKRRGELIVDEEEVAEAFIFKVIQKESFVGKDDKAVSGLNPFYDKHGVIRLKSRVSNRNDTESYRFPVILPAKHSLVNKLIIDMHVRSCHVGTQGLLSLLREKFWITGGRRNIKSVLSKCTVCRRYDAKPLVVEPPPLPLDRVRDAVAFEVTGVDFAGPLYLKSGEKAWICIFTCAIFRAVHIELTTSLSTSSFLQALRRFVSRRGRPKTMYSDNGTNFVGAENSFSLLNWDIITRETSVSRIRWKFNPPTAAWWGGFWERLIGVLKRLLRKVLGLARLNYEELLTVMCDCEAVVNARPLTYISEDPEDLVALSPAMFLRDQVECGLPECDVIDNVSMRRKVRKIQTLREDLRLRFRSEYLGQLRLLYDKKTDRRVSVGEVVLVGDDNRKRLSWPIGRVVEVFPGKDGQVRLVRVQTAMGQMLRPLQRLYPLECCSVPEFDSRDGDDQCDDEMADASSQSRTDFSPEGEEVPKVKATRSGRISKTPKRFL